MKRLDNYIKESLLDDFDVISNDMNNKIFNPLKWFYNESLKCRNWGQLYKLIISFNNFIGVNEYGTELRPRSPMPSTGIYSRFWDLNSLGKFSSKTVLCKINLKLNNSTDDSINDRDKLITIGYKKGIYIGLTWKNNKATWSVYKDNFNTLVHNDHHIYNINSNSSIIDDFNDIIKEIK